jgi:phage repressor protein C with HTH and peptisase S24 domain
MARDRPRSGGGEALRNPRPAIRGTEHGAFTYVPRYDFKAPGEHGALLRSEQIVDYLAFKKDWVRSLLGVDSRNLLLIEAIGDSMAPTLEESDLLLVDLSEPRFRHDGIYVIRSDDEMAVKRLQRRPDGALNIISDNPAYESSAVAPESVHIIGRVIWAAGRL